MLQKLREHGFNIEAGEYQFLQRRVKCLGHVVSSEVVATKPAKMELVAKWPAPKSLKDSRSFLGFVSCYRCFILNFA